MIDDVGTEQLRNRIEQLEHERADLEAALDDAIGQLGQRKQLLIDLEAYSRRPFARIETLSHLLRLALDA